MECGVQSDLDMFPGASDVVRVGTDRWTKCHADVLDRLMEEVKVVLHAYSHLPFENMLKAYEENEPLVKTGKRFAYILYGGTGAFFLDNDGQLKTDIRGIVYRLVSQVRKGRLIVEF